MYRRMFPNDPPRIVFTKDFCHLIHGDLLPGRTVTVLYDAARLPADRSAIKAFYKFIEQGAVYEMDMWTETGVIQSKMSNDTAEGSILVCRMEVPQGTDHMTLWFLSIGKSGAEYWDSRNGQNYIFRFSVDDFEVGSARVESDPEKPLAWFHVEVLAAQDVSGIGVVYQLANDPVHSKAHEYLALTMAAEAEPSGKRKWTGSAPVPQKAVVKFSFKYSAWGHEHVDTNSGRNYVTWPGATIDIQAGVLA